ncbi:hypothetical protein HN011_005250 [Eciton burchellii]|nr:hypothetical protein HN011_005250 [Eciton burchellii]
MAERPSVENIRELYRLLLQRNALENAGFGGIPLEHLMIRKSQRSPSLRLRFGRSGPHYLNFRDRTFARYRRKDAMKTRISLRQIRKTVALIYELCAFEAHAKSSKSSKLMRCEELDTPHDVSPKIKTLLAPGHPFFVFDRFYDTMSER